MHEYVTLQLHGDLSVLLEIGESAGNTGFRARFYPLGHSFR